MLASQKVLISACYHDDDDYEYFWETTHEYVQRMVMNDAQLIDQYNEASSKLSWKCRHRLLPVSFLPMKIKFKLICKWTTPLQFESNLKRSIIPIQRDVKLPFKMPVIHFPLDVPAWAPSSSAFFWAAFSCFARIISASLHRWIRRNINLFNSTLQSSPFFLLTCLALKSANVTNRRFRQSLTLPMCTVYWLSYKHRYYFSF